MVLFTAILAAPKYLNNPHVQGRMVEVWPGRGGASGMRGGCFVFLSLSLSFSPPPLKEETSVICVFAPMCVCWKLNVA